MPVLDVEKASQFYLLREVYLGYAGIDNDLFYKENTLMLLLMQKNDRDITKNL